jgi:hypothetical protein
VVTDLLPDSVADLVNGYMEQGCAAMKRTLETAAGDETPKPLIA